MASAVGDNTRQVAKDLSKTVEDVAKDVEVRASQSEPDL